MDQILDQFSETRFLSDSLVRDKEVGVLHFKTLANGHDEYGNRIFSSDLRYKDRDARLVKAAMLVSPNGQRFITDNKGILKEIDEGLLTMISKTQGKELGDMNKSNFIVRLSGNREISWFKQNSHSNIFSLDIGVSKYIIKTFYGKDGEILDVNQPYINEMLQIDELEKVFGKRLSEVKVFFPKILFATGFVMCREYVKGKEGAVDKDSTIIPVCKEIIQFVENKKGDPLWKDVKVDWVGRDNMLPYTNMLQKEDGNIIWIDPLRHIDLPS